jgi:hypothetical protein
MVSRRATTALILVQLIAFSVSAQQAAEFGRATGKELVMTAKGAAPISGSLGLTLSTGSDVFGRGSSPGYGVTAGGTLMQDRLWFFASASQQQVSTSRFANLELPESTTTSEVGARVNGQIAGNHDFSAFFESARRPELSTTVPSSFGAVTPSSFLSLRYTGVISSNAFFSTSFTRSSRTVPGIEIVPAE